MGSTLALPFKVMEVPNVMLPRSGPALATGVPGGSGVGAGAFDTSEQAPRPKATRSEKKTVQIVCRLNNCLRMVGPR
ncbi:hypothetical protein NITLEN_60211 [Nitrospira lenta]|uniref:Uncharacterized protein n=1 Tax=Nitrospira lenta TaxID=1436998 RepID=A0A330LAX1_9BACT|nr:hypothetical protein NITLEN_60211 [Nitrospira lenta]